MKFRHILTVTGFLLIGLASIAQHLNVMTFNIRYNTERDSLNAWPYRKDKAASQVLFHETHILGVQEALYGQITDLLGQLVNFKFVGVGRDDGKTAGEFSAILYDTTRLQLLQSSTFWLSQTPAVPGSKSWDAAITRIVTWARFRDRKTKKVLYLFNTHFDHIGKIARKESAMLLKEKVAGIAGNTPVIITGDFNATPSDEPIRVLTDTTDARSFTDTKAISVAPHFGPSGTFNAFQSKEISDDPIDYIFAKKKVKVLKHGTLSQTWAGRFSSDHFPVFARIMIE
jgi:endonuclease/exonuclease/phosphatase family metal-dependent hydrolase